MGFGGDGGSSLCFALCCFCRGRLEAREGSAKEASANCTRKVRLMVVGRELCGSFARRADELALKEKPRAARSCM